MSVQGMDGLLKKLDGLSGTGTYVLAMERMCRKVERTAKENCPRRTGHLERSITHNVTAKSNKVVGEVGTSVEYAPYVEFGTGKYAAEGNGRKTPWSYIDESTGERIWTAGQHPKPFLHPALEEHRKEIRKELKNAVINGVKG